MRSELPEKVFMDQATWSRWIRANHGKSEGVRLVLAKKAVTKPTSLTYQQALEEALCCGWIDSTVGRSQDGTYTVRFTPRRSRSVWSRRNTGIIEALIKEGRMLPAGLEQVDKAKADGRWAAAYAYGASHEPPADLAEALKANPAARSMFDNLSKQNRFAVLFRLGNAKKPETRARRIEMFVTMLARGETIYPQSAKTHTS
jgi:uncharacterized protein YdeI (YjbR/CyaY-like superfamily)